MKQLLVLLVAVGVSGCGDKCSNTPVATIASPSGKSKAVVFPRTCGRETAPNTQVSVTPAYGKLGNIPGNALIVGGDVALTVRWTSDASLSISGPQDAHVFKQAQTVAGISITYRK